MSEVIGFTTPNDDYIAIGRKYAINRAKRSGEVDADHVRNYMLSRGLVPESTNVPGSIFAGTKKLVLVGYRKSKSPSRKGGVTGVWKLA